MEKTERVYYPSVKNIKNQNLHLFYRGYNYIVVSDPLELADYKRHKTWFYQTNIVINLSSASKEYVFTYDALYDVFCKALNDTIIKLELNTTLVEFQFTISHTYYMIVKDNKIDQFYFFMSHGNQRSPYIHDNVYLIDGVGCLREYMLHTLETDHLQEAKMYFRDQFPHSDVTVDSVSHIVYLIQPYDMSSGIKKRLYYVGRTFDDYFDPI